MKTIEQIKACLAQHRRVDVHVHTHLCDGKAEMTVQNIATRANACGIGCVVLTPHFHRRLCDASEALYENTDESIFFALREEIARYEQNGGNVQFLLSTEADIISFDGELSLSLSREAERVLDLVSPTLNFHPLLPLRFVHLTYGRDVNALHESGEYQAGAARIGGVERVLEGLYVSQENAVRRCPYPAMLGHFFMPHSVHPDRYSCFGAEQRHLSLMIEGARRVITACKQKNVLMDLTGVHMHAQEKAAERIQKNGFLVDFQRFVVRECLLLGVPAYRGSDAHSLSGIGRTDPYYDIILKGYENEKL